MIDLPEPKTAEEARLIEATAFALHQGQAVNEQQRAALAAFRELMEKRIARAFPEAKPIPSDAA